MLREHLIPNLERSFPAENFKFYDDQNRIATLPFPNGRGELSIHDDGDEITFYLGDITHCHFSQDYLGGDKYSPEEEVIEEAIEYLKDLLSDQVVFYRARTGGRDGSIQRPSKEQLANVLAECNCFVWSRPLNQETEQGADGDAVEAV